MLEADPASLASTRTDRVGTLIDRLADAPRGEWITWQTYPPGQAQTARVPAADLPSGRVKTVARRVGPVEARGEHGAGGSAIVTVRRAVPAASAGSPISGMNTGACGGEAACEPEPSPA
jgi:hypothetical protein